MSLVGDSSHSHGTGKFETSSPCRLFSHSPGTIVFPLFFAALDVSECETPNVNASMVDIIFYFSTQKLRPEL